MSGFTKCPRCVKKLALKMGFFISTMKDSGPGFPESKISEIFEPLITTKQKGTGLGLVSCKNIIENHGGTITAKNNPTTFTIRLPKK